MGLTRLSDGDHVRILLRRRIFTGSKVFRTTIGSFTDAANEPVSAMDGKAAEAKVIPISTYPPNNGEANRIGRLESRVMSWGAFASWTKLINCLVYIADWDRNWYLLSEGPLPCALNSQRRLGRDELE